MRMPAMLWSAALAIAFGMSSPAIAHERSDVAGHAILGGGTFDSVAPQAEYYGHFLRGRVHHGFAHHGAGHLNSEAAIEPRGILRADDGGFAVFVEPNLVNRVSARRVADRLSVAHCGAIRGVTRVTYDRVERYARESLSAWKFTGRCR